MIPKISLSAVLVVMLGSGSAMAPGIGLKSDRQFRSPATNEKRIELAQADVDTTGVAGKSPTAGAEGDNIEERDSAVGNDNAGSVDDQQTYGDAQTVTPQVYNPPEVDGQVEGSDPAAAAQGMTPYPQPVNPYQ